MNKSSNQDKEFSKNSEQMSSPGLFNRVSSSVSGLLSNVSWSEWLNTKKKKEPNPGNSFSTGEATTSSTNYNSYQTFSPINSNTDFFSHERNSTFLPGTSSTPENQNGKLLLTSEDNLELLKKSLSDTTMKSPFAKFNGTLTTPSIAKKRIREQDDRGNSIAPDEISESKSISLYSLNGDIPASKKPRFSISTFGSPYTTLNKTRNIDAEDTSKDYSLYYPGKTTYGGAFNYHKSRSRFITKKVTTPRAQLIPYPSKRIQQETESTEDGGLSSAAKRILHCIDSISTPLSNSKRIPVGQPSWSAKKDLDSANYVADFHKHRPTLKSAGGISTSSPPVNRLLTPGRVKTHSIASSLLKPKTAVEEKLQMSKETPPKNSNSSSKELSSNSKSQSVIDFFNKKSPSVEFSSILQDIPALAPPKVTPPTSDLLQVNSSVSAAKMPFFSELQKKIAPFKNSSLEKKSATNSLFESCFTSKDNKITAFESLTSKPTGEKVEWSTITNKTLKTQVNSNNKENKFIFSSPEIIHGQPLYVAKSTKATNFIFQKPIDEKNNDRKSVETNSVETSGNLFGSACQVQKGSWECNSCLLLNKESDLKCVACLTAKTPIENCTEISVPNSLSTENKTSTGIPLVTNSWGSKFTQQETWECSTCLIANKNSVNKCVACETPKGPASNSNSLGFKNNANSFFSSTTIAAPISQSIEKNTTTTEWGNEFQPKQGSWDCDVCLVQNSSDKTNCAACQTVRPGANISSNKPSTGTLMPQPFKDSTKIEKSTFKFGLTAAGITNQDEWECETCLVRNKFTSSKCVACESPKDKSCSSNLVSTALTGNFKFGARTQSSASPPKFSFGVSSDANKPTNQPLANKSSFSFGVKDPKPVPDITVGFSSSKNVTGSEVVKSASVPAFSFGTANVSTDSEDKKKEGNETTLPPSSLFTFGSGGNSTKNKEEKSIDSSPQIKPVEAKKDPAVFSFGGEIKETKSGSPKQTSLFNFAPSDKIATDKNTSTFTFVSKKTEVAALGSSNPMFSFGGASNKEQPKTSVVLPSATEVQKPSETSATSPFSFGGAKTNGNTFTTFGASNLNNGQTDTESKSLFTFGKPNELKPTVTEKKVEQASPFTFGKIEDSSKKFSFGDITTISNKPVVEPTPSIAPFSFGQVNPAPPLAAIEPTFVFGNSSPATVKTNDFSFGGSNNSFSFGNAQPEQQKPSVGFSFGDSKPAQNFNFGNSPQVPVPSFAYRSNEVQAMNNAPPPPYPSASVPTSNMFNALASGGGPQRRIRKAVRRTKQ